MRQPDFTRRVVVTGLGVISPVGNDKDTAWAHLVNGRSGLDEITKFDSRPLRPQVGRRGQGLRRHARGWTRRPCAGQRADDVVRRRGRQAGRRGRRPRDHRREPRGHRRRVRLRRRRPDADDRQLGRCSTQKGPNRVAPTFIANGLVDSHVRDDRDRDRRHRPQHLRRHRLLHRHQLRRRGRRDHPPRRRPHDHLRLVSEMPLLEVAHAGFGNMRGLGSPRDGRAARRRVAAVRPDAATGSSWARAAASLILEDLEYAKARGAHIYAEVVGYGSAADGWDMIQPIERGSGLGPGDAGGARAAGRPGRRGRRDQPARHLDAGRRQARGRGDLDRVRRPRRSRPRRASRSAAPSR